jgi:hypothetical protein
MGRLGDDYRDLELNITCKETAPSRLSWSISRTVPIPGWGTWAISIDVTTRKQAEKTEKHDDKCASGSAARWKR